MSKFNLGDEVWYDNEDINGSGYGIVIGFEHEYWGQFAMVEFISHNINECFLGTEVINGKTYHNCRSCSYEFLTPKLI